MAPTTGARGTFPCNTYGRFTSDKVAGNLHSRELGDVRGGAPREDTNTHDTGKQMKGVAHALPSAGINAQCGQRERSDDELVSAARDNPAEFVALYDRYFHRVHGYVRLRVTDEATAEDVTSQVFLTALTKVPAFEQRGSFGGWLFRIAQNAVHDVYRRRRPSVLPDDELAEVPDPSESPEAQTLAALDAARLRALVATLPSGHQDLLALRYGAGLSSREIGRALGKNPAAVRVRLHRILADLRRRCSEHDV